MTEEQRRIVEKNHNLIYRFLMNNSLPEDEYYDLCAIALCKAAIKYDVEKGYAFSTYAYRIMLNAVITERKRINGIKKIPQDKLLSLDYKVNDEMEHDNEFGGLIQGEDNVEEEAITRVMLNEWMDQQKERHKKIVQLRLNGYSQKEIGKIVKASQPQVLSVLKKVREVLK